MLTDHELDILRRRAAGESQAQIAKALGITQAAISKAETNAQRKIIDAERYMQLLKTFGVSIEDNISGRKVVYNPRKRKGGGV